MNDAHMPLGPLTFYHDGAPSNLSSQLQFARRVPLSRERSLDLQAESYRLQVEGNPDSMEARLRLAQTLVSISARYVLERRFEDTAVAVVEARKNFEWVLGAWIASHSEGEFADPISDAWIGIAANFYNYSLLLWNDDVVPEEIEPYLTAARGYFNRIERGFYRRSESYRNLQLSIEALEHSFASEAENPGLARRV